MAWAMCWTVVVLSLAACGPTVVLDEDATGDATSSGPTSTGSPDPSPTTSTGSIDGSSSVGPDDTTTSTGESTGESTDETGEPSDECPPPIRGMTYLWCGGVSDRTKATTDGTWVYIGTQDDELWRVLAAGGEAESLAQGPGDLLDLEIVGDVLYWTAFFDGMVGVLAARGGPLHIIDESLVKPSSIAVGGGYAFVTQYDDDLPVIRYDLATDRATALYPDLDYAGNAFVIDDALYFATSTNNGNDPTPLWRGSFDGAPLQPVIDAEGIFEDIDVEGQTLWWARYHADESAILHTVLDEPAITTDLITLSGHPLSLTLTPERVYWSQLEIFDDGIQEGRLRSMTREGADPIDHLTSSSKVGDVLATDAGVVFVFQGALMRLD